MSEGTPRVVWGPGDWSGQPARDLGAPGAFPYTRGIYPSMYAGRPWTMRQYAGFGTAQETNQRFRALLAAGQTGLSTAFDLPTQMGYDSDHPMAAGEVGRVGVAIDTVDDLGELFRDIPLDRVSTSMTINATAATLLAMYVVLGEEQGVPRSALRGTVQNDILKEYIARGTYIYPAEPSLRLRADVRQLDRAVLDLRARDQHRSRPRRAAQRDEERQQRDHGRRRESMSHCVLLSSCARVYTAVGRRRGRQRTPALSSTPSE